MHSHIVFTLDVSFPPTNEKRLDNATLDVSSHQERKDFKHTQIQGMPYFLLHENKKENVEEQLIEPYEERKKERFHC